MKKSTLIPLLLTIYLAVMAAMGYRRWADGTYSSLRYFGIIALTVLLIVGLHFHLKRQEREKRDRRK